MPDAPVTPVAAPQVIEVPAGPPPPVAAEGAAQPEATAPKPNARQIANALAERRRHAETARAAKHAAAEAARERDAARAEAQATSAKIAELEKRLERAKTDPLSLAAELGGDVEAGVKRFVAEGTPEAKIAALEEALKERDRRDAEREKQASEKQRQAEEERARQAQEQEVRSFAAQITSPQLAKTFPYTNLMFDAGRVLLIAREIQAFAFKNKTSYAGDECAAYVEKRARLEYDSLSARQKALFGSPDPTRPADGVNEAAAPANDRRANERSNPIRSTAPPVTAKKSARQLRAEEEARDLAMLRKAVVADRTARAK